MIGSSNDESNFSHKLLLTDTQVSTIRKSFPNGSSANIKFSKTQLSKIVQSEGFAYKALGPLLNPGKMIKKIINKADELYKKVSLNDILGYINFAKKVLQAYYKKAFEAGITIIME